MSYKTDKDLVEADEVENSLRSVGEDPLERKLKQDIATISSYF